MAAWVIAAYCSRGSLALGPRGFERHWNCGGILDCFDGYPFDSWGALTWWCTGSRGSISASAGKIRNVFVDSAFDHGGDLRGGNLSRLLPDAVYGADEERADRHFAFCGGV